jgi:hypothetical protein
MDRMNRMGRIDGSNPPPPSWISCASCLFRPEPLTGSPARKTLPEDPFEEEIMTDLRQQISAALKDLETYPLPEAATRLFATLGYKSDRTLPIASVAACRKLNTAHEAYLRYA